MYEQRLSVCDAAHEEALRCLESEHKRVLEEKENELKAELKLAHDELIRLKEELSEAEQNASKIVKESAEISQLEQSLLEANGRCSELEKANQGLQKNIDETFAQLSQSERARTELVALVEQKHAESVNYHAQLQILLAEKEQQSAAFLAFKEKVTVLEQELSRFLLILWNAVAEM
ncbi:unnamed protein product [Gongylonema pulchrum]|uniref:Uncharacterized protein n=1 Tax=Gongylonema pulchrum TaxID=637853 RepID=A0A183ETH0_9BILA|nr:unnamed protein product [Gongylonema pulchrum]